MKPRLFNSYEECCAFLGIATVGAPDLGWVAEEDRQATVSLVKLFTVHKAHNKANNFVADWSSGSQRKYSAWHWTNSDDTTPSGFGFSRSYCAYWDTITLVGSRLCVGTDTEALHIAKTFGELYQDWYFFAKEASAAGKEVGDNTDNADKTAEGGK